MVKKIALLAGCCLTMFAGAATEPFILGADISWIPQREAGGVRYADNGVEKDIVQILKEHGFNYIRLRLFVDPTAVVPGETESPYSLQGYCGLTQTRAMAKRIKAAGFRLLLDFHYSDTWCDPAKQHKPVSWSGLTFSQLTTQVRSYTKQTLELFKADGALPDMVQVGNEIVGGMLWPDGKNSNMNQFATLVNAGIDGVKDVDTGIKIMIHSIAKDSPVSWVTNLVNAGVNRIDVFGLSYYSEWHGTPDELQVKVSAIAAKYAFKIAIAEYADNHERVNDIIYNAPDHKGIGTFVWEPADWNEALFDYKNNRRETNSRIDIYPHLSQRYGNDVIVSVNNPSGLVSNDNARGAAQFWISAGGALHATVGGASGEGIVSCYTARGKRIGRYSFVDGLLKGGVGDLTPGTYIVVYEGQNNTRCSKTISYSR